MHDQHRIDVRVSTLPTQHGEDVVLRLLSQRNRFLTFDDLGISSSIQTHLSALRTLSSGLFLVTGPTGSGSAGAAPAALLLSG